jgi:hypothetical protein
LESWGPGGPGAVPQKPTETASFGSSIACVPRCVTLSDGGAPFARGGRLLLLVFNLDEPEAVAERKGSIRRLLEEKWANAYKLASPRGLFTLHERQRARSGR